MSKIFIYLAFSTLFLLLFIPYCFAASPLDVAINEIAWMGTPISYNDEWIELYNNTNSSLSLDGWVLKAVDGTPEINLGGAVPANGFYLLERTDDNTIPTITADQIYTGALGNSGENLKLYDNLGNLIDSIDCSSGWFAGDNETKQTMERKNSELAGDDFNNWQTSKDPGGTPKAINSEQLATSNNNDGQETVNNEQETINKEQEDITEVKKSPTESQENTQPVAPEQTIIYPSEIVINEILPSPEGPDETEEWIEIFNQNGFEVELSGWKLSDSSGKTTTFTFPEGNKISAKGFLVLNRPTTKITLNNDKDTINLLQPNGNILDAVSYEKAPIGQSYNRVENSWTWSDNLTQGAENVLTTESEEKIKENFAEKGTAAISSLTEILGEQNQLEGKISSFSKLILPALGIAIFSGVIILVLKTKLKSE